MRYVGLLFLAIFLFSCSSTTKTPSNIIASKKMQAIIFDLLKTDEFVLNYLTKDSLRDKKRETFKMYEEVFRIHETTKEKFYRSYNYYQQRPNLNKAMFDSLFETRTREKSNPFPVTKINALP